MSITLNITSSVTQLAYSNRVYVSKNVFEQLMTAKSKLGERVQPSDPINISIGPFVFLASPLHDVAEGCVALNARQRNCGKYNLNQAVSVGIFIPTSEVALAGITIAADLLGKKDQKIELKCDELITSFKTQFGGQVFVAHQQFVMDFSGIKLDLEIDELDHATIDGASSSSSSSQSRGQVLQTTNISWKKMGSSKNNIQFMGGAGPARNDSLFKKDFNFEALGIGGLDEQFKKMFRTAFASRIFPGLVKQLGINHVRGILLYGPPGCGKTLIARQIGKVLNAREPKIINGPEVLDKFVGGSEEKIRALFADAEKEQQEAGDASMLHIIIFDEMDAIMKTRGSTRDSTGVSDSIVNQLLSKIDGVDSLNNILIIGMTNRKDMIDEAILRPGRLEVHIEITLPTEEGRLQILKIKTLDMREHKRIEQDVINRLPELSHLTKNFTGAELEGLVRNAASFALARNIDAASIKALDEASLRVEWRDFERAMEDTVPAFGNKDNDEICSNYRNGLCNYGPSFSELWFTLQRLLNQTKNSARTPLMSVLLEGNVATGKTAIAAKLAATSDLPFVRMISPDSMIGYNESQRCAALLRVFTDSYKSPQSIIFINDIERIIEYTPVGHRFSNTVLQTLLILLRKVPPQQEETQAKAEDRGGVKTDNSRRLMIIATTSIAGLLEDLQLIQAFNVILHVNELQEPADVKAVLGEYSGLSPQEVDAISRNIAKPIGIKQLLMVLEMSRNEDTNIITTESFLECLHTIGF